MEKKTVLVTGIGGNVGQGIIRNIRVTKYPVHIIGTDIAQMSAGNHLVNSFYKVPYSYDDNYINTIIDIVSKHHVDVIIPSTDYEVYHLSVNRQQIPCQVACSGPVSAKTYLDKYLTANFHKEKNIAFVPTCLPSEFIGQYKPAIGKPRKGRGSRGLIRNLESAESLTDNEYIVQLMCEGVEITSAVYVSYHSGEILGHITMERTLENGATTYCKVTKEFDAQIEKIALTMVKQTDLRGAFNIQSIVSTDGEIFPFEINCRISGTNSIRTHFGFPDVKFTLDELLYNLNIDPIEITEGEAFRYLTDVIYPVGLEKGTCNDQFILF